MVDGNEHHDTGSQAEALRGWDKGAFWYPTLDKRGALLGLFLLLLVLHFDEIFGFAASQALVGDWLPITFAYHIGVNVLHVAFMVLLYLNWPDPADEDIDRPGAVEPEPDPSQVPSGSAEGG